MATSLALFVVVYGIVFAMGIYYINRLIAKGPDGARGRAADRARRRGRSSSAHDAGREALAGGG